MSLAEPRRDSRLLPPRPHGVMSNRAEKYALEGTQNRKVRGRLRQRRPPGRLRDEFGRSRLYRNLEGRRFEDVAERAGVAVDSWTTGCAFGDYDGDGLLDRYRRTG
jgi:hypothetical protein